MEPMTNTIAYWAPLERAFERMKRQLFEPFDFMKWLVLGFAAWLAGLGSGPGGGGSNFSGNPTDIGDAIGDAASSAVHSVLAISVAAFVGLAVLLLVAVVLWLSSRGKFIFLDNVVHNQAEIVAPWKRFRKLGDSLFLWRLAFVVVVIVVVVAGVLLPAIPAALMSGGSLQDLSLFAISTWGVFFGLIVAAVVLMSLYVSLFLDSFIVPIMYRFNLTAVEAWRHLVPWLRARPGHFTLYGLFVLLLTIVYGILSVLVCLLTCCIAALPYIGTVILLPIWVAYRCFSLEWLTQFDPEFDVFAPLPGRALAAETVIEEGAEAEISDE
ncbi:MAG: hypothetical protein K8R59_04685 [Thermoanaerobaculales bacterium]|nr:hypothetical protein [Thermoanaerobaculales bacterium]